MALMKVVSATDKFLVNERMKGRLVYMPGGSKRWSTPLRRQSSPSGPRQLMKSGQLFWASEEADMNYWRIPNAK